MDDELFCTTLTVSINNLTEQLRDLNDQAKRQTQLLTLIANLVAVAVKEDPSIKADALEKVYRMLANNDELLHHN